MITGIKLEMVISRYMLQSLRGRGDRFETFGVLRSPWYPVIPLDLRQDGNFERHVYVVCVHVCLHVWGTHDAGRHWVSSSVMLHFIYGGRISL